MGTFSPTNYRDAFEIFLSRSIRVANSNGMTTFANRPAVELLNDFVAELTRFKAI